MTIKSSGSLALTEIQAEFGGSSPISLSEYYRNGAYVTSNNTGVPTSGQISFNQFYSTVKQFIFTISSHVQQADLRTLALAAGWNGTAPIVATINSGVYLWSDNTGVGGLTVSNIPTGSIINNYGYIIGRGGNGGNGGSGAGQAGGPALVNSVSGITVNNLSGAYIAGGGGGGGGSTSGTTTGGGGGGAGGGYGGSGGIYSGGAGGSIGQAGANGGGDTYPANYAGLGGGAGGGGGGNYNSRTGSGGGGGRILTNPYGGAGGYDAGGAGGSYGNVGGNETTTNPDYRAGGGGGGWGAKGGDAISFAGSVGGAGGAAISGTAVTLINSGTIYGATA